MRFKNFEIRPDKREEKNYELVKWNSTSEHCWTIALLKWNAHENGYDINSVGTRLLEDFESGLDKFVMAYIDLLEVVHGTEDD